MDNALTIYRIKAVGVLLEFVLALADVVSMGRGVKERPLDPLSKVQGPCLVSLENSVSVREYGTWLLVSRILRLSMAE
jgi:hypothetical protein